MEYWWLKTTTKPRNSHQNQLQIVIRARTNDWYSK